jgi:hypothetical protein
MSNIELKYDLMRLIMELEDVRLLHQIKGLINNRYTTNEKEDWAKQLTTDQIQQIELGKLQIQNGEYASDEEVEAEIDRMLEGKRKNKI